MHELLKPTYKTAALGDVAAALGVASIATDAGNLDEPGAVFHNSDGFCQWDNLSIPIKVIFYPEAAARGEGEPQMRALTDLFQWIDEQPPVPRVPLDAMDRGEIY